MPNIKPLHDVSEHEKYNYFAYSGSNTVLRGTLVKPVGSGWYSDLNLAYEAMNGASQANTVSMRWGVKPRVTACTLGDTTAIGITLNDVRETDENGELLIYKPQKAIEMQAVCSGQPVPIAARGTFLYSGISGAPVPGSALYGGYNGELTTTVSGARVATALGCKDSNGFVLIKLAL